MRIDRASTATLSCACRLGKLEVRSPNPDGSVAMPIGQRTGHPWMRLGGSLVLPEPSATERGECCGEGESPAEPPEFFDDRFERRPENIGELRRRDQRHATAVHPEPNRHGAGRVGTIERAAEQMRREGFAGGFHLCRLRLQIGQQAEVAAKLVRQNVQRRFEDAGNGRDGAVRGFPSVQPGRRCC